MSGRRVQMPCSHLGTVVIGTFAVCDEKGCDGQSKRTCHKCDSRDVEAFVADHVPPGAIHCWSCGAVRFEP